MKKAPRGRPAKPFRLTACERNALHRLSHTALSPRVRIRALGLLALGRGETLDRVSVLLDVTRQTIFNWREAWMLHRSVPKSLLDQQRSGRPSEWTEDRLEILEAVLAQSPDDFGYRARSWTSHLLSNFFGEHFDWHPSARSVRVELKKLGYIYKRPRYILEPDPDIVKKSP